MLANFRAALMPELAGAIGRSVEGDFDLNAPFGAENDDALVRRELCSAGERRRSIRKGPRARKLEKGRSEPIRFEGGVILHDSKHAARFGAEDESRLRNSIAANIH